jgi:alpha-ketoglutaric semialdehyde dehydrogenase
VAYGPMINARSAAAFREHWETGRAEGASLVSGGEQWTEANRDSRVKGNIGHGLYMQPCVWAGVTPGMGLFRSQVSGPSVNLSSFKDFDEGLAWLDSAPCGPSVSLYTQDRAWISRFMRESRADIVRINAAAECPEARLPYTGQGTLPGCRLALDDFSRWQVSNLEDLDDLRTRGPEVELPSASVHTDWASL